MGGTTGKAELEEAVARLRAEGRFAEAAAAAVEGYGPELLGFLSTLLGPDDADDVLADTCRDLWAGLPGFRGDCSLRTWLYVLARNAHRRHRKKAKRRPEVPAEDQSALSGVAAAVRSDTRPYLRTETKDRIAELRARLSPNEQALLVLRIDRDFSWREVAQVLSEDSGADEAKLTRVAASCRKRFERVVARLRKIAEEEGLLG